jgi:hypothetical protein
VVTKNKVICRSGGGIIDVVLDRDFDIIDFFTLAAANVVMAFSGRVETLLGPTNLNLEDNATFSHKFKIPVNGAKSNSRQSFSHHIVDFIRCRVGSDFA